MARPSRWARSVERRRCRWARAVGVLGALLGVLCARGARADVQQDAARLVRALAVQGVGATHLPPVFAFEGAPTVASVPARGRGSARCRSVIAIGERHVRFVMSWRPILRPAGETQASVPTSPNATTQPPRDERPPSRTGVQSSLGLAVLHDCGDAPNSAEVSLTMLSARAAIERVVAWHDGPLPPLGILLPERRLVPPTGPDGAQGVAPPKPMQLRLDATERQARLDGAAQLVRVSTSAESRGQGSLRLRLPAGCHRLTVHAERGAHAATIHDVDAELRRPGDSALLAADRSVAPDARLETCIGQAAPVDVVFVGAPPHAPVVVLDAYWPLGAAWSLTWDEPTRAAIAWGLWRRQARAPARQADLELVGAQGATVVPLPVEPGACYLAAAGRVLGQASALRLTVTAGAADSTDVSLGPLFGVAVAFCVPEAAASPAGVTTAKVELRARLAWWRLALWRLSGGTS